MFINHTNHSSKRWVREQLQAAKKYGDIVDMPFPVIDASVGSEEIARIAAEKAQEIIGMRPDAVMVQGEFTYSFALIRMLKDAGILVVAACSQRNLLEEINEAGDTIKRTIFRFIQFREYI